MSRFQTITDCKLIYKSKKKKKEKEHIPPFTVT